MGVMNKSDWRQIPARALNEFYLGLDIGQAVDPSAVCVMERVVTPLESWQEAGALAEELKDFNRKVSEAGRVTFSARSGKHDDLLLALSLCLFAIDRRPWSSVTELRL